MTEQTTTAQTVDFDTLILAALDARTYAMTARQAAEHAFKMSCYLGSSGVAVTLDGQPFRPGELSPHRALRLIEERGLFEEDAR